MKAVILVAGMGKRLHSLTDAPKCLLRIGNETLLERYLRILGDRGIVNVVLVVGYKKEAIIEATKAVEFPGQLRFVENPEFYLGSVLSVGVALGELDEGILLMDGDVYFEEEVLARLLAAPDANLIAIDRTQRGSGEEMMVGISGGRILDMRRDLPAAYDISGEAVGFYRLDREGCTALREAVAECLAKGDLKLGYEDILPSVFQRVLFGPVFVDGLKWREIDFEEDVERARTIAAS